MNQIHKGSIVWDPVRKKFGKVLTTPGKGELPDALVIRTGRTHDKLFTDWVLVSVDDGSKDNIYHAHNNQPCVLRKTRKLISKNEYLQQRTEVN